MISSLSFVGPVSSLESSSCGFPCPLHLHLLQLYHEVVICNLMETLFYHEHAVEAAGDLLVDLVDYCARRMQMLITSSAELSEEKERTPEELFDMIDELMMEDQERALTFQCCMSAVNIFRFLTDHVKVMSLSVVSRILDVHDFPVLVTYLLEERPWLKREAGKVKKWVDSAWKVVEGDEIARVCTTEIQLWLTLNNLVSDVSFRSRYEFTRHRKETISKNRRFMNEVLLDQIPVLVDLHRFIEEMRLMQDLPNSNVDALLVQQEPEVQQQLLRSDFQQLAADFLQMVRDMSEEDRRKQLQSLSEALGCFDEAEDGQNEGTSSAGLEQLVPKIEEL